MRRLKSLVAICLSGWSIAAAADDDPLKQTVDRIIGHVADERAIPGVIVGVSWHGRRSYFAYSGTGEARFDRDTLVEIGSITKVFTTALFAEAVQEGRMRTDEPIGSHLRIPLQPCAGQVTPLQLADFSSGMPTLPRNVPRELWERGIDHYTREDFFRWISHWDPGEGYGCDLPAPYNIRTPASACSAISSPTGSRHPGPISSATASPARSA